MNIQNISYNSETCSGTNGSPATDAAPPIGYVWDCIPLVACPATPHKTQPKENAGNENQWVCTVYNVDLFIVFLFFGGMNGVAVIRKSVFSSIHNLHL